MKLRKNDEVVVLTGREKGKTGFITRIDRKHQRVYVKDINIVVKHKKPTQQNTSGGIESQEAPLAISNVALKAKGGKKGAVQPTRVGYKIINGKKVRIEKKTGKEV